MVDCPFCKAPIEDDLARFGGHCPKCFIEIPGEETPTDPGEVAQSAQNIEKESKDRRRRGLAIGALVAAVLLISAAGIGYKIYDAKRLQEEAALAEVGEVNYFTLDPEEHHSLASDPTVEQEAGEASTAGKASAPAQGAQAKAAGTAQGSSGRQVLDFRGSDLGGPKEEALGEVGRLSIDISADGDLPVNGPGSADGSTMDSDLSGTISPKLSFAGAKGLVVSGGDVRPTISSHVKSHNGQMKACYERRRKAIPRLAGSWTVTAGVRADGSTTNIQVAANGASDAELERCLARAVADWSFPQFDKDYGFQQKYSFDPDV